MNLPRLDPATPGEDLHSVLRALAGETRSLLLEPDKQSGTQIHDIRVNAKKLRSLLKLAGGHVRKETRQEAVDLLRRIKESFGTTRDDEVMRSALESLCPDIRPTQLNIPELSTVSTETPADVLAAADRLGELVDTLDFKELSEKALLKNWLSSYRTARKIRKACRKDHDDTLWHTWRKRIKDVFYQASALSSRPRVEKLLSPLESLADLLGENHDLAILQQRIAEVMPDSEAADKLQSAKKKIMRKALRAGKKCLGKKSSVLRRKLA